MKITAITIAGEHEGKSFSIRYPAPVKREWPPTTIEEMFLMASRFFYNRITRKMPLVTTQEKEQGITSPTNLEGGGI